MHIGLVTLFTLPPLGGIVMLVAGVMHVCDLIIRKIRGIPKVQYVYEYVHEPQLPEAGVWVQTTLGKSRALSRKLDISNIMQTLSAQLPLSWSHYLFLMGITNSEERRFYEIECAGGNWSLRELKRQFGSSLYERLARET